MSAVTQFFLNILKFHKKKIAFFLGSILFGILVLFPYDDLSGFATQKITELSRNQVYVQFDGISFGLMPQLGVIVEKAVVESVFAPTLEVDRLGFAPKFASIFGSPAGKLVAYGLFKGDATLDISPSSELEVDGDEMGLEIELENMQLRELSKFLQTSYNFPVSMNGETQIDSRIYIDPTFAVQPAGDINLLINNLDIPSSNLPLNMNGVTMGLALPALKLTKVNLVGNFKDRKFFIKEGKIGESKDDLYGSITGDIFFTVTPKKEIQATGYDIKINLNISDNLKRQLGTILGIVDIYKGIGEKYKFASLKGVRYAMRLSSPRSIKDPPRVSSSN